MNWYGLEYSRLGLAFIAATMIIPVLILVSFGSLADLVLQLT